MLPTVRETPTGVNVTFNQGENNRGRKWPSVSETTKLVLPSITETATGLNYGETIT